MNSNAIHTLLNIMNVIVGAMLTMDWTSMGVAPHTAGVIGGVLLMVANVLKVTMTASGAGSNALLADPKKVEEKKIQDAVQGTPPSATS